ncbi:MAG: hypothetical protein U1E67_03495 [Hyphomicrobiales bacterium]
MSGIMRLVSGLTAAIAILILFEIGGQLVAPGKIGLVDKAEAIIGRPLTPMSYAGVARRTVRRCAVGVYYC